MRTVLKAGALARRAAGAWSPTDKAGLAAWYKDTGTWLDPALSIPSAANADQVGAWVDQSASGKNAVQATTASKLSLLVPGQNGLQGLSCAGSNHWLSTASIAHGVGTGGFWWLAVVIPSTVAAGYRCIMTNGSFAPALYIQANKVNLYFGADQAGATLLSAGLPYLIEVWRSGTTIRYAVNGTTDVNTFTNATSMANAALSLAASANTGGENFAGELDEVLFYNSAPTAQEQAGGRSYLNARWGIY